MPARLAALVSAVLLAAACAAPVAERTPPSAADPAALSLWVLGHGWHTSIVVRRADVDRTLWPEADELTAAAFLEIAWGDREFYMAMPATAWMAVKAAVGSGESVLHVVGLDAPIATYFSRSEIVELPVSRRSFEALTRFVSGEHARDAAGRSLRLRPGLYGASWFYAGHSRYSLSNTCNTWIARALEHAGLPVTASGVITAGGVLRQVRPLGLVRP